jgi:intracellular septation protein
MKAGANQYQSMNPILRLGIEMGPLVIFFAVNAIHGIFAATGVFMIAIVLSLAIAYAAARHIPTLPLVSGLIVLIFGGLTLYLQNETFIKLKPTIVNLLFASVIFGGLLFGKNYVKSLLGTMVELKEEGWRQLAVRWGLFFVAMAILNEVVWRNFSTDTWVTFKVFGFLPLTVVFALAQTPLMNRYAEQGDSS